MGGCVRICSIGRCRSKTTTSGTRYRVIQVSQSDAAVSPGPWRPLRNATFRNLLAFNLVSDIGTFMQSVGAAWLMTMIQELAPDWVRARVRRLDGATSWGVFVDTFQDSVRIGQRQRAQEF